MKENLIYKNGFLFLKVASKQHASYITERTCGKNAVLNRPLTCGHRRIK